MTSKVETPPTQQVKCPKVHYKPDPVKKMIATEWQGNKTMKLNTQRPKPMITEPKDVIVKITTSTICG
jgi:hypothetical protein